MGKVKINNKLLLILFGILNCLMAILLISNSASLNIFVIGTIIGGLLAFCMPIFLIFFSSFLFWISGLINRVDISFKNLFTFGTRAYTFVAVINVLKTISILLFGSIVFNIGPLFNFHNAFINGILQTVEISSILYLIIVGFQIKDITNTQRILLILTTILFEAVLNIAMNIA